MAIQDPSTYSSVTLNDPYLDVATLGHIANTRPDLRPLVARHRNAPQDLVMWINAQAPQMPPQQHAPQAPQIPQAPNGGFAQQQGGFAQQQGGFNGAQQPAQFAAQQAPAPQPQQDPAVQAWAAWFQQNAGRAPSAQDYNAAVASGQLRPQYASHAPAAAAGWKKNLPLILGGSGLLAIIACFLPAFAGTGMASGISATYMDGSDGWLILIPGLLALAAGILAFVMSTRPMMILAGVVGLIAGVMNVFVFIVGASKIGEAHGMLTLSIGAILVLISGLLLLASAIMTLVSAKQLATK